MCCWFWMECVVYVLTKSMFSVLYTGEGCVSLFFSLGDLSIDDWGT